MTSCLVNNHTFVIYTGRQTNHDFRLKGLPLRLLLYLELMSLRSEVLPSLDVLLTGQVLQGGDLKQ